MGDLAGRGPDQEGSFEPGEAGEVGGEGGILPRSDEEELDVGEVEDGNGEAMGAEPVGEFRQRGGAGEVADQGDQAVGTLEVADGLIPGSAGQEVRRLAEAGRGR